MKSKPKKSNYVRPSWDEYFLSIAELVGSRSTCDRGRPGTVIVKNKQILSTGYAGSPAGLPHCDDVGHQLKTITHEDGSQTTHCMRTVHSEQNAICMAAKSGISIEGSTVYTHMTPCRTCAMMLINCGIKRVYCEKKYHVGEESEKMFKKVGIKIEYKSNTLEKYEKQ